MKIYFSGSIRGGRDDAKIYHQIITYLKNFGEVLTEHIGDSSLDSSGEKKGNIPTPQAIEISKEQGLDLVEISPKTNPPVCKVMDYGKYKY